MMDINLVIRTTRMIIRNLPVLAFLLLFGCKSNETVVFDVDPHKISKASFNDFYKLKEVIVLETSEQSVMGGIDHIIFTDEKMVMAQYWSEDVGFYTFERSGAFLDMVNKRGNGPGEYGRKLEFFVLNEANPNQLIMVKTEGLYVYDHTSWQLVKTIPWSNWRALPGSLPNGHFLRYSEAGTADCFFELVDEKGEKIKGFFSKPTHLSFNNSRVVSLAAPIRTQTDQTYVTHPLENRIYEYHSADTCLTELYRIAFTGFPELDLNSLKQRDIDSQDFYKNAYRIFSYNMGKKYHLLSASAGDNKIPKVKLIITPSTGEVSVLNNRLEDKENELPIFLITDHNATGPVAVLQPGQLLAYPTDNPNSWGSKLKAQLAEDANPVILIYEER